MASPEEMENVSLTTLTTALMMSELSADEDAALEVLGAVKEAAIKRMDAETINTDHHRVYVEAGYESFEDALSNEKEVLKPYSSIEKYTIRPHIPKEGALNINDKFRKFLNIKQRNKTSSVSSDNLRKVNFLNSKNVSDSLPSISLGPSYRKNKIQASASIQSGKINQSLNQQ